MKQYEFMMQAEDDLRLYGRDWEPDDAPKGLLCLVHGLGEHSGWYEHVAAHLNAAGYALLAYDQRGHGRSEGRRGHSPSYETTMNDIGRLLAEAEARYPGSPRYLYGHSLGGSLVINCALRCRPAIEGVIAISPALRPAMPIAGWKQRLMGSLYDRWSDLQVSNGLDITGISHDPEVLAAYRADPLVHDRVSMRFGSDILSSGEWALAHAAEFPLPLLLIHGIDDRLTSAQASREFADEAGSCCTFLLLDGCYHETHNEPDAHRMLDAMVGWLDTRGRS